MFDFLLKKFFSILEGLGKQLESQMKLTRFVLIIFAIFVSVINCSDQKPKGWKDVIPFLNPLASFQPSIISKGHVKSFELIESLNDEQRRNLKEFTEKLGLAKSATLMVNAFYGFIEWKYGLLPKSTPIPRFIGNGLRIIVLLINTQYLRELKNFQGKLDAAIKKKS